MQRTSSLLLATALVRMVPGAAHRVVSWGARERLYLERSPAHRALSSVRASLAEPRAGLERTLVKKLLAADDALVGAEVVVKGWVRTLRSQKSLSFIDLNDGSSLKGVQIVAEHDAGVQQALDQISTGAAIVVQGTVVESAGDGQLYEIRAASIDVVGACDESYPLQKKRHSLEFLRSIAHLRARTNIIGAVSRVRSALAQSTHAFFAEQGFHYIQTPLITASDCEGAGEMFRVTTLGDDVDGLPTLENSTRVDYAKDFFGKPAFLTVSGQLAAETYACALGSVYTFGERREHRVRWPWGPCRVTPAPTQAQGPRSARRTPRPSAISPSST